MILPELPGLELLTNCPISFVTPCTFEPFYTTKEVGKGTGQGLTISYDIIVKKHGGTIEVETEEAKGTTFIIRIPLQGGNSGEESSQ